MTNKDGKDWSREGLRKRFGLFQYAPDNEYKGGDVVKKVKVYKVGKMFINVQNCKGYIHSQGRQISSDMLAVLNSKLRRFMDEWIEATPKGKRIATGFRT